MTTHSDSLPTGSELIAAERTRQLQQLGYTPTHDDDHRLSELSRAALAYTLLASKQAHNPDASPPSQWPWHTKSWKPSPDPVRNLIKAGALIAAEIDRLRRTTPHAPTPDPQS